MRRIVTRSERCLGCLACEVACTLARDAPSGVKVRSGMARASGTVRMLVDGKVSGVRAFPLRCHQCEEARCVVACAPGAMERTEEGIVRIDEARCTGCGACVIACPQGAIAVDKAKGKAFKCDLCVGRERPACVDSCLTGALSLEE